MKVARIITMLWLIAVATTISVIGISGLPLVYSIPWHQFLCIIIVFIGYIFGCAYGIYRIDCFLEKHTIK
jgi:hypothetical protein